MNKTEARQLMMKYLIPQIEKYGFKERGRGTEFEIVRKVKSGEDVIMGGFTDYNPQQEIIYGTGKRDRRIIDILLKLQDSGAIMSLPVNKKTYSISVTYSLLNKIYTGSYMPRMETEQDVEKCVNIMVDFLINTAFPILENFEDLREIDKMINGDEPWTTDWRMPHTLGGYFYENRLIIAKLVNNPRYEDLIDFNYKTLERLSAENGSPFTYDRNDLSKPLPALIKLLEDVKPLY